MKNIFLILWEFNNLLNVVVKTSNLSMSSVKAARSQFKMEQKRCRGHQKMQKTQSSPHLRLSACHCLCWQQRQRNGGGGRGLHNYCLLSSSQRINFQTITYFPTHADTHTSLVQRGFISYHLRNHYQNTDTICFRAVCGSPVMANVQTQKQPRPSCPTGDNV